MSGELLGPEGPSFQLLRRPPDMRISPLARSCVASTGSSGCSPRQCNTPNACRREQVCLTAGQKLALLDLEPPGFRSLRPYHNLHGDIEFCDKDGTRVEFDGRDLDALHRLGMAKAEIAEEQIAVRNGPHPEVGEMEATHRWTWTARGSAVAAFIREVKDT